MLQPHAKGIQQGLTYHLKYQQLEVREDYKRAKRETKPLWSLRYQKDEQSAGTVLVKVGETVRNS